MRYTIFTLLLLFTTNLRGEGATAIMRSVDKVVVYGDGEEIAAFYIHFMGYSIDRKPRLNYDIKRWNDIHYQEFYLGPGFLGPEHFQHKMRMFNKALWKSRSIFVQTINTQI